MATEAQRRAGDKYQREQIKTVGFRFHVKRDADILEWLESVENKTEYVRQLIRQDMERPR